MPFEAFTVYLMACQGLIDDRVPVPCSCQNMPIAFVLVAEKLCLLELWCVCGVFYSEDFLCPIAGGTADDPRTSYATWSFAFNLVFSKSWPPVPIPSRCSVLCPHPPFFHRSRPLVFHSWHLLFWCGANWKENG